MRPSRMGTWAGVADMGRNVRGGSTVTSGGVATVVHGDGRVGLGRMRCTIGRSVLAGRHAVLGPGVGAAVALVVIAVAKAAASGLRNVGDDLQSTGNRSSGASATSGIG